MKKMFNFLDNLNIVRILQAIAIILLILAIPNIVKMFTQAHSGYLHVSNILAFVQIISMTLASALYQPALLLALAEIIKLMREKNAKNN